MTGCNHKVAQLHFDQAVLLPCGVKTHGGLDLCFKHACKHLGELYSVQGKLKTDLLAVDQEISNLESSLEV